MMDEKDQHVMPAGVATTGLTQVGCLVVCCLILLGRNRQWCCNHRRHNLFQRSRGFPKFGSSLLSLACSFFLLRAS